MIKNAIFDIGNVLYSYDTVSYIDTFDFAQPIRRRLNACVFGNKRWCELDLGVMTLEQALDVFIEDEPELESEIRQIFADWMSLMKPIEENIQFYYELKAKGYKLYILSNFAEQSQKTILGGRPFLDEAEGVVFSWRIKQIKPEPGIYDHLLNTYGLAPEECVFFDDMPQNIQAANAKGIHGILFENLADAKKAFYEIVEKEKAK